MQDFFILPSFHLSPTSKSHLSTMGAEGLRQAARLSLSKAHYLAGKLGESRLSLLYPGEYFHEFVTTCSPETAEKINAALAAQGILGGLPVAGGLLWCATELVSQAELDRTAAIVKEVL